MMKLITLNFKFVIEVNSRFIDSFNKLAFFQERFINEFTNVNYSINDHLRLPLM
jgi:hypothetical protein